jgi:hypothetical protein
MMNPKQFFKRWGEGIRKIPQDQLLVSEMIGFAGSIFGTLAAGLFFIFAVKNLWVLAIPLGFNVWLQISQLVGKWQQYKTIKEFQNKLDELDLKGG